MRTKTLLLTAALTAAGVATSMAQVYSVNMVGYINVPIGTGFTMVANQLNGNPDNKVTTLLPAPPENTAVFKFNPTTGGYVSITFVDGAWEGDDVNMTLSPGEGVFLSAEAAFTATFVGEVALSTAVPVRQGFQIISSALPQSLGLDGAANDGIPAAPTGLGFPVAEGDQVFRFNRSTGGYISDSFVDGAWEGDSGGAAPVPSVSEAFFFFGGTAGGNSRTWNRNFVVGVD